MSDRLILDDGASQVEVEISTVIKALRNAYEEYVKCVMSNKSRDKCYVEAIGILIDAFGSALPSVFYDEDLRYFAVKSADYRWLLYDSESNTYKVVKFRDLVAKAL
ncbi:hypothetical protein [Vulcanisaeta distributa]|uniref:Uncharacterized protein n=1 Tax=Vulcanisaeta distributa (strain DSM 14429 / JCM 11212 / NBRC 100878 / IC-017) TaxID=572478 RepID=E1QQR5_VULDI|nr:hypothetical protein [Vulcanisaeta distributa]ADN51677.1 conserved hypothetical protein [Vulcanisaeta distributa DSM 14429]